MSYTFAPLTPRENVTVGGGLVLHILEVAGHLTRKDKDAGTRVVSPLTGHSYGYSQAQDARRAVALVSENLPARTARGVALYVLSQTGVALSIRGTAVDADLLADAIADADADAIAAIAATAREAKARKAADAKAAREAKAAADAKAARKAARDAKRAESSTRNVSSPNPRVSPVGDTEVSVPVNAGPTAAEIRAAILTARLTVAEWQELADALQSVAPVKA